MTKQEMLKNVELNATMLLASVINGDKFTALKYRKQLIDAEELALYEGLDGAEIDDARYAGYLKAQH